jgi:hypothetical protein
VAALKHYKGWAELARKTGWGDLTRTMATAGFAEIKNEMVKPTEAFLTAAEVRV